MSERMPHLPDLASVAGMARLHGHRGVPARVGSRERPRGHCSANVATLGVTLKRSCAQHRLHMNRSFLRCQHGGKPARIVSRFETSLDCKFRDHIHADFQTLRAADTVYVELPPSLGAAHALSAVQVAVYLIRRSRLPDDHDGVGRWAAGGQGRLVGRRAEAYGRWQRHHHPPLHAKEGKIGSGSTNLDPSGTTILCCTASPQASV